MSSGGGVVVGCGAGEDDGGGLGVGGVADDEGGDSEETAGATGSLEDDAVGRTEWGWC